MAFNATKEFTLSRRCFIATNVISRTLKIRREQFCLDEPRGFRQQSNFASKLIITQNENIKVVVNPNRFLSTNSVNRITNTNTGKGISARTNASHSSIVHRTQQLLKLSAVPNQEKCDSHATKSDYWWHELNRTIRYWTSQPPSNIPALELSLRLLFEVALPQFRMQRKLTSLTNNRISDPIYGTVMKQNKLSLDQMHLFVKGLLRKVIKQWRESFKYQTKEGVTYKVSDIWGALQSLDEIPDVSIFNSLLTILSLEAKIDSKSTSSIDPLDVINHLLNSGYEHQMPTAVTWNAALTVWAKRSFYSFNDNPDSPYRAEELLDLMQAKDYVPDAFSISSVIYAWASTNRNYHPDCEVHAQRIFDKYYSKICSKCSSCYFHIIHAYCTSPFKNGAIIANRILQSMIKNYTISVKDHQQQKTCKKECNDGTVNDMDNILPAKPTTRCFTTVMACLGRVGADPTEIEELFHQMQQLLEQGHAENYKFEEHSIKDIEVALLGVMVAYSRRKCPERAELLLHRLSDYYNQAATRPATDTAILTLVSIEPTTYIVNTCINAWAESGHDDAPEKAEALFHRYFGSQNRTNRQLQLFPDEFSYCTVMKVWAVSHRPDAPERCEAMLKQLWDAYDRSLLNTSGYRDQRHHLLDSVVGNSKSVLAKKTMSKPNTIHYNIVLLAWANASTTGDPRAPLRADLIYQEMMQRNVQPTQNIYFYLIQAWVTSTLRHSDILKRINCYYEDMVARFKEGDVTIRPMNKIYSALIYAYKRASDGHGAETILEKMIDDHVLHGNKAVQPNSAIFHNVMSAWANQCTSSAPVRVEAILRRMKELSDSRGWDCQPSAISFSILLKSWVMSNDENGGENAEMILREMIKYYVSGDKRVKPNIYAYSSVITAFSRSKNLEAPIRAQALFDDMVERYEETGDLDFKPTKRLYIKLFALWMTSSLPDAPQRALALMKEMEDMDRSDQQLGIQADDSVDGSAFLAVVENSNRTGKFDVEIAEEFLKMVLQSSHGVGISVTSFFDSLIEGCKNSQRENAAEMSEKLLRRMKDIYHTNPTVQMYLKCILCWKEHSLNERTVDPYQSYCRAKVLVQEMLTQLENHKNKQVSDEVAKEKIIAVRALIATLTNACANASESSEARDEARKEFTEIKSMMERAGIRITKEFKSDISRLKSVIFNWV